MSTLWTIRELAERAARLLDSAPPAVDGRVREVPNERLIRWYTTIGLLDPPLARRGRVALYGPRHLLQLVAVKRRQADGLSIAAIQAELAGATDAMLRRIARVREVPDEPAAPGTAGASIRPAADGDTAEAAGSAAAATARDRFWARPADAETLQARQAHVVRPVPAGRTPPATTLPEAPPPEVVLAVRLAPGVTIVLDRSRRRPDAAEMAVLHRAAEPLLAALAGLGLTEQRSEHAEGMTS